MSEDEVLAAGVSLVLGAIVWGRWVWDLVKVARRPGGGGERLWLVAAPLAAVVLLFEILRRFSASDVRDDPVYFWFYLGMGIAWTGLGLHSLVWCGLGARDDVLERGNPAAALALAGATLGITLCFAGGNIGEGPGWWVVVFCAVLATGALFLLWALLGRLAGVVDAITIDRDAAAGARAAGFFVAAGLILGRAVAGTWEGAAPALSDFVLRGSPAAALLVLAILVERQLRPSAEAPIRPVLTHGAPPALLYLGVAAAALLLAGPWS
jgi:uncharacterized membrane protein YjfL (UPF0719 family)